MAGSLTGEKFVLAAILLLALVLRVIGLNQPLWYDELITLHTHLRLPWSEMMSGYEMNHHYLYSLQTKLVMGLFGESAWSVRIPALLFGVGSIWVVWALVKDVANTKMAHIVAGLLAISYHHIWFSQNARGYTELMFWCALGLLMFLRGFSHPTRKRWIGFGVVLALAVFTHLTGFFFFFSLGFVWLIWALIGLITKRIEMTALWLPALGFIIGGVLTALLYLPVLPGVFENAATVGGTSQVDAMQEYQNPIWTVLEAVGSVARGLGPLIGIIAIAIIGLSILGAVRVWKRAPLFPMVVFAHIILTMILLYALGMRIWPRFFFVDIGFLLALIVLGVAYVCDQIEGFVPAIKSRLLFGLGVAGMFVISAGLAAQNYRAPKQNIPAPMALIEAEANVSDDVYAVGFVGDIYVEHLDTSWRLIKSSDELDVAMSNPAPKWLVVGFPARSFRAIAGLEEAVEGFDLVERFPGTLGDGAMLVYRQKAQ